jgi:hypothetical protein
MNHVAHPRRTASVTARVALVGMALLALLIKGSRKNLGQDGTVESRHLEPESFR